MVDKEIIVQNLALELTRKCNLNCTHCLRGKPQEKVMSDRVIERIFEDIDGVYNLQFSGGETSLAVDKLKKVIEEIKKNNVIVRSAAIFTNAVNISDEYIETLLELKKLIEEINKKDSQFVDKFDYNHRGLIKRFSEDYPLQVIVSLDQFHLDAIDRCSQRQVVKDNIEKLIRNFPVEIDKICNYTIYDEGNGKFIVGIHKSNVPLQKYAGLFWEMKEGYRDLLMIGPIINISYDGKIIEPNKSYDHCDTYGIGNINEESFYSMLKKLQQSKKFKLSKSIEELYKKYHDIGHEVNTTTKMNKKMMKFYKKEKVVKDYSYLQENSIPNYDEIVFAKSKR